MEGPPARAGSGPTLRHASEATSDALLFAPGPTAGFRQAHFEGFWWVEAAGPHVVSLKGRDAALVWLDGALVFQEAGGPRPRERARVDLGRGLHALRADFRFQGPLPVFKLALTSEAGGPPRIPFPDRPSRGTRAILPALAAMSASLPGGPRSGSPLRGLGASRRGASPAVAARRPRGALCGKPPARVGGAAVLGAGRSGRGATGCRPRRGAQAERAQASPGGPPLCGRPFGVPPLRPRHGALLRRPRARTAVRCGDEGRPDLDRRSRHRDQPRLRRLLHPDGPRSLPPGRLLLRPCRGPPGRPSPGHRASGHWPRGGGLA